MNKIPVALQLWSVKEDCQRDYAGTIAAVAALGYGAVELAGGFGSLSATAAADVIAGHGLKVAGMHVSLARLRSELPQVIGEALRFGTDHLICPFIPRELFRSAEACRTIATELDAIGARVRGFGLSFHYHHHGFEFARFDGRFALDWLLDACAPANVGCECDVYWVKQGGGDPAQFIREQGRRIRLLHLKDEKLLGDGPVDFPAVFAAVESIGAVQWYIVEQEHFDEPPLVAVGRNLDQLRRWGQA